MGSYLRVGMPVLPLLSPMLASSGPLPDSDRWTYEPKLDGWRVLAYVDGALDLRTRSGRPIAPAVPEVAGIIDALRGHCVVLDGELIAGRAGQTTSTDSHLAYRLPGRELFADGVRRSH